MRKKHTEEQIVGILRGAEASGKNRGLDRIKSPNPFWLASAPPTNMGSMVERAFDAG